MQDVTRRAEEAVMALGEPGVLAQAALAVAAVLVGALAGRWLEARLEGPVRGIHGRPMLLRILAVLLRRLPWIVASAALWLAAGMALSADAPGGAALLRLVATLATAWTAIAILVRVIRNRAAARAVAVLAWVLVTAELLGVLGPLSRLLDAAAVTLGETRISALAVVKGFLLLAALLWIAAIGGRAVDDRLRRNPDITPSFQVLIGKLVRIGLISLAVLVALTAIGLDITSLTVFSGAIGLGLGFGLQKVVSNFVSGIIILLDKSIKPGDVVEIATDVGWVRSLRARYVSVVTRDGHEILVPNEDFVTQKVVNWSYTDPLVRIDTTFGVAYSCDPHAVRRLAVEAAQSVARVVGEPAPVCHLTEFGAYSVDFVLRFWIADPQAGLTNVRGQVLLALWDAFQREGISIPYPVRDVILRRPDGTGDGERQGPAVGPGTGRPAEEE